MRKPDPYSAGDWNLPFADPFGSRSVFKFFSEIIKSAPETCKRIHHLESLLLKSFVVVFALIKIAAAAASCDRNDHCLVSWVWWKRAWRQLRVGVGGVVDHFYAFASPSKTCFIKESPGILCDTSTDFNNESILGPWQLQHCIYDKDLRAVHHQSSAFLPSVLCNMMWSTTPWRLYEP